MYSRRNEWKKKIKNKNIVIFGAGNFAKKFYNDFNRIYSFIDCVTNNEDEKVLVVDGCEIMDIHRPNELKKYSDVFIVICVCQSHDIQEQLRSMGYEYGEDFIESEVFRMIVSTKRLAVFYGVCYIRAIYTCLSESEKFTREYDSMYWLDYMPRDVRQEQLFLFMLKICDLYVCNAYLFREAYEKNNRYMKLLQDKCNIISIPILIFNGYYPCRYDEIGQDNQYNVVSCASPFSPFITPDRNINRLIEEGRKYDEIIECISDEFYYEHKYVQDNFQKEIRKLELAEKPATIKICNFLKENHGKQRIFLNEKHISNIVILEMAQRILEYLELERDIPMDICDKRLLYTSEVPVYPSVINALELDIYRGKTTLFTFNGDIELTFEEYVERYVDYCSSMKKYIDLGYFPM